MIWLQSFPAEVPNVKALNLKSRNYFGLGIYIESRDSRSLPAVNSRFAVRPSGLGKFCGNSRNLPGTKQP
jgi:hypothetical protein